MKDTIVICDQVAERDSLSGKNIAPNNGGKKSILKIFLPNFRNNYEHDNVLRRGTRENKINIRSYAHSYLLPRYLILYASRITRKFILVKIIINY